MTNVVPVAAPRTCTIAADTLRAIGERQLVFPAAVVVASCSVCYSHRQRPMVGVEPADHARQHRAANTGCQPGGAWVSRLGSTLLVVAVGLAGVVLAARRCRSVAVVMLGTVVASPTFRVAGQGSGGSTAPGGGSTGARHRLRLSQRPRVGSGGYVGFRGADRRFYVKRRWVWWALTTIGWAVIGLVAWCRVSLGVHWTSDVVGLAIAFVALSTAEAAVDRRHRPDTPGDRPDVPGARWSHGELLTGPGTDRDDPETTAMRSGAPTPKREEPTC